MTEGIHVCNIDALPDVSLVSRGVCDYVTRSSDPFQTREVRVVVQVVIGRPPYNILSYLKKENQKFGLKFKTVSLCSFTVV